MLFCDVVYSVNSLDHVKKSGSDVQGTEANPETRSEKTDQQSFNLNHKPETCRTANHHRKAAKGNSI
jgi:hypothetical protein